MLMNGFHIRLRRICKQLLQTFGHLTQIHCQHTLRIGLYSILRNASSQPLCPIDIPWIIGKSLLFNSRKNPWNSVCFVLLLLSMGKSFHWTCMWTHDTTMCIVRNLVVWDFQFKPNHFLNYDVTFLTNYAIQISTEATPACHHIASTFSLNHSILPSSVRIINYFDCIKQIFQVQRSRE